MPDRQYLDPQEFIDAGYLQEANRLFFHPLGLALEWVPGDTFLWRDSEDRLAEERVMQCRVWDERDDPEGIRFAEPLPDHVKADAVARQHVERRQAREDALGYWIQPVEQP